MNYKNFAYSLVATAPSPADSGLSLVVTAGEGVKFPAVPFYATIWQAGVMPSATTAEIVLVTTVSTDTFTIARAKDGTTARVVVVGDQISAAMNVATVRTFKNPVLVTKTSVYTLTVNEDGAVCNSTTPFPINLPAATGSYTPYIIKNINTGNVTVTPSLGDTIDGNPNQILTQWDSLSIVDYAVNLWIVT